MVFRRAWTVLSVAAVLATLAGFALLPTPRSSAQVEQGATMTVLRGQVAVVRSDGSAVQPAPSGTVVNPGDEIRTLGSTSALITFFAGTEIELDQNTTIAVEEVSKQGDRIDISLRQAFGTTVNQGPDADRERLDLPDRRRRRGRPGARDDVRGDRADHDLGRQRRDHRLRRRLQRPQHVRRLPVGAVRRLRRAGGEGTGRLAVHDLRRPAQRRSHHAPPSRRSRRSSSRCRATPTGCRPARLRQGSSRSSRRGTAVPPRTTTTSRSRPRWPLCRRRARSRCRRPRSTTHRRPRARA